MWLPGYSQLLTDQVKNLLDHPEKIEQIKSSTLIIDGLFGIGLNKKVESEFLKVINTINSVKSPVVSLDCPSGLDCDQGTVNGGVVKADMTLSFGLAKPGFFVLDGPAHVGKLRVIPIGYSYEVLRGVATTHFCFTEKLARRRQFRERELQSKLDKEEQIELKEQEKDVVELRKLIQK